MAKLIYATIASLDGYIADEDGKFDWGKPDDEVHGLFNDLVRPVGTHLYGRRMYEVMLAWETLDAEQPVLRDFAELWRGADKVVYSRTLEAVSSARTRIERSFDPDAVAELKASSERDLSVSGAHLAAQALQAGLVDEIHLCLAPIVVGGGNPALPEGVRLELQLLDERRFDSGFVYLRYATGTASRDSR